MFRLSDHLLDTASSAAVICQCRVVRVQPAPEDDDVLIAAEIATYVFEREQRSGELPELPDGL